MQSKINFTIKPNGSIEQILTDEDKIFQGQVGTVQYFLFTDEQTADKWLPTNLVLINLTRPDDETAQVKMVRFDGGWVYTSNGWETDVDIAFNSDLIVLFTMRRYSAIDGQTLVQTVTTEEKTLTIFPSSGYTPLGIDIGDVEQIQNELNRLDAQKVDRISVDEIPAEITYNADGEKTPNVIYYNFVHNVIDQLATVPKTGSLFVVTDDATQAEWFFTVDKKLYIRTIVGATVGDFRPFTEEDLSSYTYSKAESNLLFVHLLGDETIAGIKTFESAPIVPNATADTHAVNRQTLQGYTYSKEEVDSKFTAISFDTHAHFEEWLAGTYERVDGKLPSNLVIGNKVIIIEQGQNNYQVIETPVVDITDFKILVEDNKNLAEISFTPQEDIDDTNANDALMEVNRKTNLKTQIVQLADLTILPIDWALNEGVAYFNYYPAEFTDPLKQKLELNSGDIDTNNALYNDKFVVLSVDNIVDGENLGIRCYANKIPSVVMTFTVFLETYVDSLIEPDDIMASLVAFNNTATGMVATNVQSAIVELKGDIGDVASDLSEDIGDVASDLTTALGGTEGDLFVIGSTGVLEKLPVGDEGQVLEIVSGVPVWKTKRELLWEKDFSEETASRTVDLSEYDFEEGNVLEVEYYPINGSIETRKVIIKTSGLFYIYETPNYSIIQINLTPESTLGTINDSIINFQAKSLSMKVADKILKFGQPDTAAGGTYYARYNLDLINNELLYISNENVGWFFTKVTRIKE